MAEVAKFRRSEEIPTGWNAAQAELIKSPNLYGAMGVLTAPLRPVETAQNVASGFRAAGKAIFPGWDDPYGSSGNSYGIADYAATSINQQGGFMPLSPQAQAATGQPPGGQLTNEQVVALAPAQGFRPAPAAPINMVPAQDGSFVPAPTVGNVEDPRAENYGRGITEILNAPGQQGRSFTNLIPAGAPVTGINEMTQRFRSDPQGAASDSGEVLLGRDGRGSFRTETMTPAPATATAPPASLRQPKTIEDYLAGVRTSGGPGDLLAMGLASRLSANDVAMANRDENLAARGIRQAQADRRLGIEETNAETARGTMRTAQAKSLYDAQKVEAELGVKLEPSYEETPIDPANPLLGTTKTITGFASKDGANPVYIPMAAMQAYRTARAAATTPEQLKAVEDKFRNYYQL